MRLSTLLRVPGALTTEVELHLRVLNEHYRSKGIVWALRGLAKRTYYALAWIALLPLSVVLHLLGYRCLTVSVGHIGHLAADLDGFVRDLNLGGVEPRKWLLLAPPGTAANEHLLTYWAPYVTVVQNAATCHLLAMASRWLLVRYDVTHYLASIYGTQKLFQVHAEWGSRSPVLQLRDEDAAWVKRQLAKLGLPDGAWFACVHVREGGYLPYNEHIQRHRNADVRTVIPAMEEITRRGGWCIRMGDPSMTSVAGLPGVIDYAHHPLKSPRLDVALCARARFFLGCTSGLALVGTVFGVPSVLANMIPVAALAVAPGDLSIPKLLWSEKEARHLRFEEILGSEIGSYYFTYLYERAGVRVLDNKDDEIRDLTAEMLDRLEGKFGESEEDRDLQRRYKALFKPGHYSYGAASRVGAAFLRKYKNLLV